MIECSNLLGCRVSSDEKSFIIREAIIVLVLLQISRNDKVWLVHTMITKDKFVNDTPCLALTRPRLVHLKSKALRSGAWFTILRRTERVLIDLTVKIVDRVRSPILARTLLLIVKKLEDASENRITRAIRDIGFPHARKLSLIAQNWGNKSARDWAFDLSFARFIATMHLNSPILFSSWRQNPLEYSEYAEPS